MKITNIDSFIEEFRNGRDIWSKASIELAVREIEKQRKRIAELEQERRWISVDEKLPEYDTEVLTIIRGGDFLTAYYYADNWWASRFDSMVTVTHWQPLPQPPQEGE